MLSLKSPAKINLFLRILGKRSDGYHEIASLFQAIDLADTLHFRCADRDSLTCSEPTLSTGEGNLIVKARRLFRLKTGIEQCFAIDLQKKIPQQAGLGGGSSNAATTLWALNALCGHPVNEKQLAEWGSEIGSDVSFFLSLGTSYCTGRGEILEEVPALQNQALCVIKPSQGLSTPAVYRKLNVSELMQRDPKAALASFFSHSSVCFNDLEVPAFELEPKLAILKKQLEKGGFSTVLMSGSGSSFFCFGQGNLAELSGCGHQIFNANYINRQSNHWYW